PLFHARARRWVRRAISAGRHFDVAHQLTPIALRYPSPVTGLGIPVVLGPLAGSIETPGPFEAECAK
ncbi:MAG: glycosyltransferase family 1 protein, partial [Gammaproteobacteria bacterium]|nr:glycosyltransferase family 1 protein [Gammaproteobacteria bacterium]